MASIPGASFANSWHLTRTPPATRRDDSRSFPNSGHLDFSQSSTSPRMSYPNSDHLGRARSLIGTSTTPLSDVVVNESRIPVTPTDPVPARSEIPQTYTMSSLHLDRLRSGLPADVESLRAPPVTRHQTAAVPSYQSIAVTPTGLTNDADSPPSYSEVVKNAESQVSPPPYNAS